MIKQQDKSKDHLCKTPILNIICNPLSATQDSIQNNFSSKSQSPFQKYRDPSYIIHSAFKPYELHSRQPKDSTNKKPDVVRKHRGNYRKYTIEQKQSAVRQILQGVDAKQISQKYGIPRRNLLRWKKNGCQRKQGGGRPTDAEMEHALYTKIDQKIIVTQKQIRSEAKKLSKLHDFKASKGWYCKFSRRYNQWKRNERQKAIQRGQQQKQVFLLPEVSMSSQQYESNSSSQEPNS